MIITEIITDNSLMELTKHGSDEFPIQYYYDDIKNYKTGTIPWHWHKEMELVLITLGEVICSIGNDKFILSKGDAILINSNVIHKFECSNNIQTILEDIVFSPQFISPIESIIYNKYILPFIDSNISHIILKQDNKWQNDIILNLSKIFELCKSCEQLYELKIKEKLINIWLLLYSNIDIISLISNKKLSLNSQTRVKNMVQFIKENYQDKITLTDIAVSANISKSEALRCFKSNLNTSPIKYLTEYRLYKAKNMLKNKNITISEISSLCGFDSVSYFDRVFKRQYGLSPRKYRSGK